MYSCAADEKRALFVWYPQHPTASEWDTHFQDVAKLVGWTKAHGVRPAVVLLANDFDRPNAKLRQRLAEITGQEGYDPYMAFVNSNVMLRGLLTMLGWMHTRPAYELNYVADETAAIHWLQERRGESLPTLTALIAEARANAERRVRSPR